LQEKQEEFEIMYLFSFLFRIYRLIATAINTAATDKVVAGRKCNAFVLSDLPAGKYSKMYEADMKSPAGKPLVKATVK
jgi:hypothetical protein